MGFWEDLQAGLFAPGPKPSLTGGYAPGTPQEAIPMPAAEDPERSALRAQRRLIQEEREAKDRAAKESIEKSEKEAERRKRASDALASAVQSGVRPEDVLFDFEGKVLKAAEFAQPPKPSTKAAQKPAEKKKEAEPKKQERPDFSVTMTKGKGGKDVPLYTGTGDVDDVELARELSRFRAENPDLPGGGGGYMQGNVGLSLGPQGEIINPGKGWVPESVRTESRERQEDALRERAVRDPGNVEVEGARNAMREKVITDFENEILAGYNATKREIEAKGGQDKATALSGLEEQRRQMYGLARQMRLIARLQALGIKIPEEVLAGALGSQEVVPAR